MKKILTFFSTLVLVLILTACNKPNDSLVISKLYSPKEQFNNIIELYNNSDKDLELDSFSLRFYTNGATEVSNEISLSGVIEANGYYVISGNGFRQTDYADLVDLKYDKGSLPFNGNDAIELVNGKRVIDSLGYLGLDVDYSSNATLIRLGEKEDYKPAKDFDKYNFITYVPNVYKYLKNDSHQIKSLEQLLAGPRLEERYKTMPYIDPENENLGGGGAAVVNVTSISDGDTATFGAKNGFPGGSMRYFYLDTPEVNGSYVTAEPWGYVASKYNKEYQLNAAYDIEIHVQSIPGYNLNEGYGRNIGLVWINGYLSQFMIVSEGLSKAVDVKYNDYDLLLSYKDVPYLTFMVFAERRAVDNGWATKGFPANPDGEKSPDWNYQANRLATEKPIWTPHLPVPWIND